MSGANTAEQAITPDLVAEHGLSPEEYARICEIMEREPNITELGIFSVMWSEHCSYKSSRVWLKKLPTEGPQVICGTRRERRYRRHRRWAGRGVQDGKPQPSLVHRALSGRGNRRRRHHARCVHHGCSAGRKYECLEIRLSRTRENPPSGLRRGRRHRRLRQLHRRSDRRWRGQLRRQL